ncbi:hypothetical protein C0Q70_12055 [Pomacea canaliculata]|uniref:Uncharacterized protein n=2 Tax=Pomacea canaliculata TaxID=400727 RepID=A0A2T7P0E8_POMCA|nr:hypothetical protein C0Q70_12055 [Pomacea canaliculata]
MAVPRSVFSVLFIVFFSVDVAELTCTELEIIDPKSGNMTHKVSEVKGGSLNFRLSARNCSATSNTQTIVTVSTSEEGFRLDVCKFSLTMENCTMTQSSPVCSCSNLDKGLAHYTPASWSGDKNVTIRWTDRNTKAERQQTILFTSLGHTASHYKIIGTLELTVIVTATLSCILSFVVTFVFIVRKRCKKRVTESNRVISQEASNLNTTSIYDVAKIRTCTRDRNMVARQEARYLDRSSVYDLANARAFGRGESSHYSEILELPDTYLHPSPVLPGYLGRQVLSL